MMTLVPNNLVLGHVNIWGFFCVLLTSSPDVFQSQSDVTSKIFQLDGEYECKVNVGFREKG